MQAPWHKMLDQLLDRRPTVGRLVALCEENYRLLLRLAPALREMRGDYLARCPGHADLQLTILEQGPYTTLVRLTHRFGDDRHPAEPDAVLRVYHDAREVEAVTLRQSALPTEVLYEPPGLCNKWRLNWFLGKWLGFCGTLDYHFVPRTVESAPSAACLPAAT